MAIERGPANPSALRELTTTAIANTLGINAVDVFVYDTRKDSDGGAWRKRTSNTSWYNETLNTATRGSRREFPAVAVIVLESLKVTIYDGDDPDLPMWMVINATASLGASTDQSHYITTTTGAQFWVTALTACSAVNGSLIVANSNYVSVLFEFPSDTIKLITGSFGSFGAGTALYSLPIYGRNSAGLFTRTSSNGTLVGNHFDVAMTVLPNAPISPATGLPVPTIAFATSVGTTVIQNTGAATNITCNNASYTTSRKVTFLPGGALGLSLEAGEPNQEDSFYVFNQVPQTNTVITVDQKGGTTVSADAMYASQFVNTAHVNSFVLGQDAGGRKINEADGLNFGTDYGLTQIFENRSAPSYGLVNYISSKFNTGWMAGFGNRCAWLSDSTAETIVGSGELITNGTFDANVTGWTAYNSTTALSGNTMQITRSGGGGPSAYQTITCIPGKTYTLSATINSSGSRGDLIVYSSLAAGGILVLQGTNAQTVNVAGSFLATQTTYWVQFAIDSNNTSIFVDNITCRAAEPDRYFNTRAPQIYGTLTKTAVETGNDLVGYSGYGSGNYLRFPTSTSLSFGAGDFSVLMWMKPTSTTVGYVINQTVGIRIAYTSGKLRFHVYGDGGIPQFSDTRNVPINAWHQVLCQRRNGQLEMYVNGALSIDTAHSTGLQTFTTATETLVGVSEPTGGSVYSGQLALIRFSANTLTAEQIAKSYNDEKELFQPGAKGCLYGSSDAVTAVSYDDTTQLLHAGTSAGRSVFEGIRRIENTTTAVSAAISASNGLVAEQ